MSKKQDKIETIEINGQRYVLESDIKATVPDELDGLKYAIVRSRNQGVMAGYVVEFNTQGYVLLKRARQLWRWNSKLTLIDLAEDGINKKENCKFSGESSQNVIMTEACGIIYCTEKAGKSIRELEAYNG